MSWNLTPGEARIMDRLIVHGCTKLIARELDLSPRTVEQFISQCKKKMGHRDRVVIAVKWATKEKTSMKGPHES